MNDDFDDVLALLRRAHWDAVLKLLGGARGFGKLCRRAGHDADSAQQLLASLCRDTYGLEGLAIVAHIATVKGAIEAKAIALETLRDDT